VIKNKGKTMKTSFQIGKIIGIPIKIDISLLLILALFTYVFATDKIAIYGFVLGFGGLPVSLPGQLVLGAILSVLFFICVLLHELGHSYVTQRYGYKINGITLFIFGGVSQIEEMPREPRMELTIAVVGPLVSLLLGGIFYGMYLLFAYLGDALVPQIGFVISGTLAFYNVILGFFNLIPAFPIDGGRVLRAALARTTDYGRATRIAASVGKVFAIAMAVFGFFYNFWLILIAVFVYVGASQEAQATEISIALEDLKVKDIMTPHVEFVSPELTLHQFTDFIHTHKHTSYPVLEHDKLVGIITVMDLHNIQKTDQDATYIRDVMHKDVLTISPDEAANTAFKTMIRHTNERMIVKEGDKVLGILSWSDLLHAIQLKQTEKKYLKE
jgi:Zn-dependent protease/CBS domain-containing protein